MEVGELAVSLTNESWEHRCGGVVERAFGVVVAGVDGSVTDARHFRVCLSRKALVPLLSELVAPIWLGHAHQALRLHPRPQGQHRTPAPQLSRTST